MPVIQMIGMLLNNIIYYFEISNVFSYTLDFVIGNSIITIVWNYFKNIGWGVYTDYVCGNAYTITYCRFFISLSLIKNLYIACINMK